MSYECFELTINDRIAHLRLNRPEKANSMVPSFWTDLPAAVNALSRDASARVLVISAEGKHFSSGMDISVFTDGGLDSPSGANRHIGAEAFRHHCLALQEAFNCLEQARMPVLVAIQGAAVGGAMDLRASRELLRRYVPAATVIPPELDLAGCAADGARPPPPRAAPPHRGACRGAQSLRQLL